MMLNHLTDREIVYLHLLWDRREAPFGMEHVNNDSMDAFYEWLREIVHNNGEIRWSPLEQRIIDMTRIRMKEKDID
jgi:hypothetical protein